MALTGQSPSRRILLAGMATVAALLFLGLPIPTSSQQANTPPGIVYSIPITITNNQAVSTPAPFQQMISVDSAAYASYEAPNLQNVEFFDSGGAVIPSWLESGNSNSATDTVYWLKIANGIQAGSSTTIYMGFAPPSSNLFNQVNVGEASQLSAVYGEYDDGPGIFSAYYNMESNPVVSVNVVQGGSYAIASSSGPLGPAQPLLQWTGYSGGNELAAFSPTQLPSNLAVTAWVETNSQPFDIGLGATSSSSLYNGYFVDPGEDYNANFAIWSSSSGSSNNGWGTILESVPYSMSPTSWYTLEFQLLGNTLTGYVEPFQNTLDASSASTTAQASISQSGFDTIMLAPYANSNSMMTSWALIAVRAAPPNGVMPTVSVATAQASTTSTQSTPTITTNSQVQTSGATTASQSPSSTTSASSSVPVWAFKGAYAIYSLSVSANGYSVSAGSENYTIGAVNTVAQTFIISTSSSSSQLGGLGTTTSQASFSSPSPFPTVSSADLSALNAGNVPSDLPATSVATGVTLKVPAGTFTTDELSMNSGGTTWIDSNSGLIIQVTQYSGAGSYSGATTETLESTNIPSIGSGSSLALYAATAVAVLLVAALGGFFILRKRKGRTKTAPATSSPSNPAQQALTISPQATQKLEQLKSMLDAGLITQTDYDEQKKKLTG